MSNTIFPGLVPDLDLKIISFCDTATQLQLGRVNQGAFQVLTNQFFIDRFYGQHPLLKTYEKLCCDLLRSSHEANGGKVMCKVLDPEYRASFPGRFSSGFVQEGAAYEMGKLLVKRQPFEEKNRAICGSHYGDPSSPIDQAWKKYKRREGEAEVFRLERSLRKEELEEKNCAALSALVAVHSAEQFPPMCERLHKVYGRFLDLTEEGFISMADEERPGMDKAHLPLYRSYAQIQTDFSLLAENAECVVQKVDKAKKKYDKLEVQRADACDRIEEIDVELARFPQKHATNITSELTHALSLENTLKNKSHLDACIELIRTVLNNPNEKTPENLARIRNLINFCTYEQETEVWKEYCIWGAVIWRELYFRSADGVIEDSWAENHFKDHLLSLGSVVLEKRTLMGQRISFANFTQAALR